MGNRLQAIVVGAGWAGEGHTKALQSFALARDFMADVRGKPQQPYLTFRDGWRYQVAIEAIRSGKGWTALPR